MKKICSLILIMVACLVLSACSSSTSLTVQTEPGTEILTSNYTRLGVADATGKLKLKISDDNYSAFLISHRPNTDTYIPFALDYKKRSTIGAELTKWTGGLIGSAGLFLELVGGIMAISEGELDDTGTAFMLAGLGGGVVGWSAAAAANDRLSQTAYDRKYKYLSIQNTNQDLPVSVPDFAKENPVSSVVPAAIISTPADNVPPAENTSRSSKKLGQKSSKTFKDFAAQIQGRYVGKGQLTKGNKEIESYNDISVIIRHINSSRVGVVVKEKDGSTFFDEESEYSVSKDANGDYQLVLDGISTARITIDSNKKMIYIHPKVNIDGDLYQLSITGTLVP